MADFEKVLLAISPHSKAAIRKGFAAAMPDCVSRADLTTPLRLAHFLGQTTEESAGLTTTTEFASGREYEGRRDLGNVEPGDGVRFKGHGLIQTTGRTNHAIESKSLGVDFIAHPEVLAAFPYAALSAADYWARRKINQWADRDDIRGVTHSVNGGYNGLATRQSYLERAKHALADVKGALELRATEEKKKVTTKSAILAAPVTATVSTIHPAAAQTFSPIVIGVILVVAAAAIIALAVSIARNNSKANELSAAAKGV